MNLVRYMGRRLRIALRDKSQRLRHVGTAGALIGILAGSAATWHFTSDKLADAFESLPWFSDNAQDDGAGDLPPVFGEQDRHFSLLAPLDDERVIAAVG